MLTTRDGPTVVDAKARYWSNVAIFLHVSRQIQTVFCDRKLKQEKSKVSK